MTRLRRPEVGEYSESESDTVPESESETHSETLLQLRLGLSPGWLCRGRAQWGMTGRGLIQFGRHCELARTNATSATSYRPLYSLQLRSTSWMRLVLNPAFIWTSPGPHPATKKLKISQNHLKNDENNFSSTVRLQMLWRIRF